MRIHGVEVFCCIDGEGAKRFIKSIDKKCVTPQSFGQIGEAYGVRDVLFGEELRTTAESLLEAFRLAGEEPDTALLFVK